MQERMACECDVCKILKRFAQIKEKLGKEDSDFIEGFINHWIDESDEKSYLEAIVDGTWPGSDDVIKFRREKRAKKS
jgi:hypothetical protein